MEKLINAEALKELLENRIYHLRKLQSKTLIDMGMIKGYEIVISSVDKMKDYAENVVDWVPCKEELPETSGHYYVTDNNPIGEGLIVATLYYEADKQRFSLPGERWYDVKPIAWMRKPEPYKEL